MAFAIAALAPVSAQAATTPDAPTSVVATAGNASASVTWIAPASDGGDPISGYMVTSSPSGITSGPVSGTSTTVSGLANGTAYTFTVTATNSIGTGAPSAPSNAVTPATVPDAPTNVVATAGNGSAGVSWAAPASDGGSPITGYTVTSSPGGITSGPVSGTSTTVTGLTNGNPYTFTVTATNNAGTGSPSAASNGVTPAGVPGAPTNVVATAGNASAGVSWTAPASDGGSPITGYTVTSSPGGITSGPLSGTSTTVSGLANGTTYTFTVTAANSAGTGTPSAPSNSVTPATVPGAPTNVVATAGDRSAGVNWTAPASDGGSPITSYTVTSSPAEAIPPVTSGTSIIVSGLHNGTSYTFTVTANNNVGAGPVSASSNSVTPSPNVPGAPTNVTATAGDGSAAVSWTAPASDGGNPISGYTVTSSPDGITTGPVSGTSTTIGGLTNGIAYTFTVTATNSAGTGLPSAPSNAVTPIGKPLQPTGVAAAGGYNSATVTWTAPNSNGSAILSYTVVSTPGGITTSALGSATSATVAGLTNGVGYSFTVTATNSAGAGPASASSNVVVPGPPTVRSVSPNSGPYSGGTSVVITGTNFSGTPSVQFGPNVVAAANVAVNSPTSITVKYPPGSGVVDVRVTTGATSAVATGDRFTYTTKCLSATVTPDNPSPQPVGTMVTFTTVPIGCPNPVFEYWLRYPNGTWVMVRAWSTNPSWAWPTRLPLGTYIIHVGANKSGDPLTSFEALGVATFTVTKATLRSPCTGAHLSAVQPTPQQSGTIITFNATSSTCLNPQYLFYVQAVGGPWILGRGYGGSTYFWNTAGNGVTSYNVDVWVRENGSGVTYQSYFLLMGYTLSAPLACTGATLTPDKPSPSPSGAIVTFNASSSTCSQPQYLFYVQAVGGPWILGRAYGSSTYVWITTGNGKTTYNIDVWVRQNGSKASWQTYKLISYMLI